MRSLVSILISAFNAEQWIRDTIKSALEQTWLKKEIIIVDDGSTDNTLRIAREFESRSVKVITQDNKGASAARNKAFELAQGDYIQWLDADDLLAPDKISQQLKKEDENQGNRVLLSSSFGKFYYRLQKTQFKPHSLWKDLAPVDWILIKFTENLWMHPATWLVSRELTELAGPWNEQLSLDDDGEYFCRVVAASEMIKFLPAAKSYYRRSNLASMSNSTSEKACESLFLSLNLCSGHLRSLEDSERTRRACLKLLQTSLILFYPEKHDILGRISELANDLGGDLSTPTLSWKYLMIKNVFGWKTAKNLAFMLPKLKARMAITWDRLIFDLTKHGQSYVKPRESLW